MRLGRIVAAVVVVALVATAAVVLLHHASTKKVSGIFTQAVQLYPNDDVKLRGVKIGTIDAITPVPGGVRIDMTYDADAPVSANARAAIIAPTLLNRRYVQLAPSSHNGPKLPDGITLGPDRTAVPVEYDQIKEQLNQLAITLGPANGQTNGALTRVLATTANNFRGNGHTLNDTINNLSKAFGTLSDGRNDLYYTISNLNTVVGALRQADSDVYGFNDELATTSKVLADSSGDPHKTLDAIDSSFGDLKDFLKDNRDPLATDVDKLGKVVDNLSDNRQAIADVLQRAPNLVTNFQNIHDAFSGAIGGALASETARETFIGGLLVGAFVGGIFTPFGIPLSGLDVERNGSKNYIEPRDGQCKKPDPHPHREPEYNPVVTPPRAPDGGVGTQPYFTRNTKCSGVGSGSDDTVPTFNAVSPLGSLLSSPTGPEPVSPLKAPAPVNPLTAIFSGGK
jgi:phospholipid/cholesterol/gamma-HCH transport system substrate-binding protein